MSAPNFHFTRLSLALLCLPLLAGCPSNSVSPPAQPTPSLSPQPTPTARLSSSPAPQASPNPVNSSPTASPTTLPTATPTAGPTDPGKQLASLRFEEHRAYFDYYGQTRQLKPIFLNARGEVLQTDYPLEWVSSSPSLLTVSPQGLVKALVSYGTATITARVSGTTLAASTILNISATGGGGGGGGGSSPLQPGNAAPQIVSLTGSASTVLGANAIVKIQALATDADDTLTDASYSWSCTPTATCGSFSQTSGTTTYWTSASTAGDQTLLLKVSDGTTEVQQSLIVRVDIGNINVRIN